MLIQLILRDSTALEWKITSWQKRWSKTVKGCEKRFMWFSEALYWNLINGSGILIMMYPQRWKPGLGVWCESLRGRVYWCQGKRSCFRTGSCVGQQYKAALMSPWYDLRWEMQRADTLVFRDGLRRVVAREEGWSGVWYFKLGCWEQCGEHRRGEAVNCSETATWPRVL